MMKVDVNGDGDLVLKHLYNGVVLESDSGEKLGICMRDSGFEFNYHDTWYSAKDGIEKRSA